MNLDSSSVNPHDPNILIIENDESWQKILAGHLEDVSDLLTITKSVREARNELNKKKYDIIVTDLKLSKDSLDIFDDLEIMIQSFRWTYLSEQRLPIIVVTGHAVGEEKLRIALNKYSEWIRGWLEKHGDYTRMKLISLIIRAHQNNLEVNQPVTNSPNEISFQLKEEKKKHSLKFLIDLRNLIDQRFDLDELNELCFQLGEDYQSLAGSGKTHKVRELVNYCDRRNKINELLEVGEKLRPDINWPRLPSE